MLIEDYKLEICDVECVPSVRGTVYSAKLHLDEDVSEVMPYLNAVIDRADYSGNYQFISWEDEERKYILRPDELAVSGVLDRRQAVELASKVTAMINDIWERRSGIEPVHERRQKPQVLSILKLLPGTNCGNCGVPTCMAFAVKLAEGEAELSGCPPMKDSANEPAAAELKKLGL